jgi:hypothetical protein
MKDIDKMNLAELADALQRFEFDMLNEAIANRLRVIHEETRWVPVSERMPTENDGMSVHVIDTHGLVFTVNPHDLNFFGAVAWKRTTPPEGKP